MVVQAWMTETERDADAPRLSRIELVLVERGVVSREALAAAKSRQRGAKRPLVEILLEQDAVDEDLLVSVLADATGLPVAPDSALTVDPAVQALVPADVVQRLGVLPLRLRGEDLVVATGDPLQVLAFDELRQLTGRDVHPVFAKPSAVRAAIRAARGEEEMVHELVKNSSGLIDDIEILDLPKSPDEGPPGIALDQLSDAAAPTVRLVNLIISDAIRSGASDLHIEAEKSSMRVRFRVDGVLRDALVVPVGIHSSVVARIKIVATLDIIETRRPQDGRVKVSCGGRSYDLRISTLPSFFGEKVVIRVLDSHAATFDLDRCGIEPTVLARWRELIHRPNGLVLMTGPTGSGKTSTLYASLLELRDPSLNIVTVEDPVEYQFEGITHVPVRSNIGMTFAAALRSILRQDPDIVMVGEIRDAETAAVCLQAAMTGHLVLSTLHTNDAIGAVPRLLDLGADPSLVANSLLGVMAQRLARTICPSCAEPQEYSAAQLRTLGWDPARGASVLGRRGAGCSACRGIGLKGRTALVELVVGTPGLRKLTAQSAPREELLAQAQRDGTRLLVECGLDKVVEGVCTPDEVLGVAAQDMGSMSGDDTAVVASAATAVTQAVQTSQPAAAPCASPAAAPTATCAECAAPRQPGWRFCPSCAAPIPEDVTGPCAVVCDDDPIARRVAAAALRGDFPRIVEVASGAEALDVVSRERPDLLVVDHHMPGVSGIDVIRELRSRLETATLPIVMLTASQGDETEAASLEAGADDYLQKPVSPARLRTRARAVIATHRRVARDV